MKPLLINASCCLLTVLLHCTTYAQKSETMERANAVHFPDNGQLILKFDPNGADKFQYLMPGKVPMQTVPKYFSYPLKNSNLEIQAEFINPLRYKLTLKSKDSDDPNYKVESEFFEAAGIAMPSNLEMAAPAGPPPGLNFSILIPQWFDVLNVQPLPAGTTLSASNVLSKLKVLEDFLAGEFTIGANTKSFQQHLSESIDALASATTHGDFISNKNQADAVARHIQDFRTNLMALVNEIALEMKRVPNITYDPAFTTVTDNAIRLLKLQATEFTRVKFTVFDAYKKIIDELTKVSFSGSNIMLTNKYVTLKAKKDLIINVIATPLTIDKTSFTITEGETKEVEFYVILRRPQVEASAGIAYVLDGFRFNAFSTTGDSTDLRISNTETRKFFLPTLFLNFYRNASFNANRSSEHLFILPQLGIGTGKEFPTVLLGAGYVVPHKVVISAGVINAWIQTLKSGYTVHGSISTETAKDISTIYEYEWKVRPYLSVQFKL